MTSTQSSAQSKYEKALRPDLDRVLEMENAPYWLQKLRKTALESFENIGLPTRRQEAWRYVDMATLLNQPFQQVKANPTASLPDHAVWLEMLSNRLVFINGVYMPALSELEGLPTGVVIGDLKTAMTDYPDHVQRALAREQTESSDAFVAINTALFEEGVFISLPDNTVVNAPLQLVFITQTDAGTPPATYLRTVVDMGANAKMQLVSVYTGDADPTRPYLTNAVTTFNLASGSQIEYVHIQDEGTAGYHMASTTADLAAASTVQISSIALGGRVSRHSITTHQLGEGAHSQLLGLNVLSGDSEVHDNTLVDHTVGHGTTDQFYKNILGGHARSEFDGTIQIRKNAQRVSASQLNKNLLLSDTARVLTRPQLRIDADDVKCTHGATVGQLSEEELFYLASRGLSGQVAQTLLTYGFAEAIVERIGIPIVRETLAQRLHAKLNL